MSVKDRIEDSKLLFQAGRLEGSLISVLLAVAATSRKRYPKSLVKNDNEAFKKFLADERPKLTAGKEILIEFCGETLTLESVLYKFVRNSLIHEAELDDHVSFEYGNFLFDKRGTTDYFTFSSELVLLLSYIVESAKENAGIFPSSAYEHLPYPLPLKQTAIVRFSYDAQLYETYCYACSVQTAPWEETGVDVEWLHFCGVLALEGKPTLGPSIRAIVPCRYITSIAPGPTFRRTKSRRGHDIGIFGPNKLAPMSPMSIDEINAAISALQIPLVETLVVLRRPHYSIGDDLGVTAITKDGTLAK